MQKEFVLVMKTLTQIANKRNQVIRLYKNVAKANELQKAA